MDITITQPHPAAEPTVVAIAVCCHSAGRGLLTGPLLAWYKCKEPLRTYEELHLVPKHGRKVGASTHCQFCGVRHTIVDVTDPQKPRDRSFE